MRVSTVKNDEYDKSGHKVRASEILLSAVNKMAFELLEDQGDTFEATLQKGLDYIGELVGVDRIYIWKNETLDGALFYSNIYGWIRDNSRQGLLVLPKTKYLYSSRWSSMLSRGECVNSPVSGMPPEEQEMLRPYDIKSLLVIPVHMQGELWGFLSFDDCGRERVFTRDDEQILRSASLMIAGAISRYLMTLTLLDTTTQLRNALLAAQEANLAKSNFLAAMSHEIRTPLNAIIGMTRVGKTASDMDRMLYAFDRIDGASNHLLGVINNILDISKIEAGKFELAGDEFVFEDTVQNVVNVISFRMREKKHKFSVFIDRKIPRTLIGDEQRLAQVVTNLLANAVKFTPEERSIWLDACLAEENDLDADAGQSARKESGDIVCTLKILVSDTGIGLSPEQQARLFRSYQQAESDTARKYGGTGLGLVISKQIVGLMGGKVWIESELGAGATFGFTARLGRGEEQKAPLLPEDIRSEACLLFVHDDPETLRCVENIAGQLGARRCAVVSGAQIVNHIDNNPPYNMYFIDWDMPDVDPIALTRRIIIGCGEEKPVIIMVSDYAWSNIDYDMRVAGVSGFLAKPLFAGSVARCVSAYLAAEQPPPAWDADEMISFKGRHFLLAEDIEINQEIVLAMFGPTLATMDCVENGAEALKAFANDPEKYDLIFMDVQMPEMDGYEATRRIRALGTPRAGEIPIVAMTANVFREDVEKCFAAGMNAHLSKPLDIDATFKIVQKYLPQK